MPIEEYEKEKSEVQGIPVLVEMTSTQNDMTGVGFFSVRREENGDKALRDSEDAEKNEYTLVSEGVLSFDGKTVTLSYEEAAIEGTEGCSTVISFEKDNPLCVTVERRGPLSSAFVISGGERIYSVYNTPFGVIDMCIYGKKVENSLCECGGGLYLDYAVELRGLTAQRTRMKITVTCRR